MLALEKDEDFSTPNSSKWDFKMLRKQYKAMGIDFEGVSK